MLETGEQKAVGYYTCHGQREDLDERMLQLVHKRLMLLLQQSLNKPPGGGLRVLQRVELELFALEHLDQGASFGKHAREQRLAVACAVGLLLWTHVGLLLSTHRGVLEDRHETASCFQASPLRLARRATRATGVRHAVTTLRVGHVVASGRHVIAPLIAVAVLIAGDGAGAVVQRIWPRPTCSVGPAGARPPHPSVVVRVPIAPVCGVVVVAAPGGGRVGRVGLVGVPIGGVCGGGPVLGVCAFLGVCA